MQLNDIQQKFKHQMLGDKTALLDDADLNGIFETGEISLESRLNVYRTGILEKLKNVLAITYPSVEKLTGEDFFRGAAYQFIRQNPPRGGDMNLYGKEFPSFLGALKEAQGLPYLKDIALYDWITNKAYYAADDAPVSADILSSFTPDDFAHLTFEPRASLFLFSSIYPIDEIHDFCSNDSGDEAEPLDITKGGVYMMIYRPEYMVRREHLTKSEYDLLDHLFSGQPLGEALEEILKSDPDFGFQAFLSRHMSLGTFKNITLNTMEGKKHESTCTETG